MVDRANLPKINGLYGERSNIQQTLKMLDEGGRITSMAIGKMSEGEPKFIQFSQSISTVGWEYPPQMTGTIKEYLHKREEEITRELIELGVTGLDEPDEPEPAAAAKGKTKRRAA